MEFIYPELKPRVKHPAVYAILIDKKWLYIGSSVDARQRFFQWKAAFSNFTILKSKNIKKVVTNNSVIEFIILEHLENANHKIERETYYIKVNEQNPFLLNRCLDASSGRACKPLL